MRYNRRQDSTLFHKFSFNRFYSQQIHKIWQQYAIKQLMKNIIIVIQQLLTFTFITSFSCNPGQFQVWPSSQSQPSCQQCPPGCLECEQYSHCDTFMFPGIKERIQNGGCVPDYLTQECKPCLVENCKFCESSTEKTCSLCNQPYVFDQQKQQCVCQDKFYGSKCQSLCPIPNCNQCQNQNQCLKCRDYFQVSSDKTSCDYIEKCSVDFCKSCIKSRNVCQSCYLPFELGENGLSCVCPKGQGVNTNSSCSNCLSNCDQCEYPQINKRCTKCSETYLLSFNHSSNSDVCICPNQTSQNKGSCVKCMLGCNKCAFINSTEICFECHSEFILVNNYTECRCPQIFGINKWKQCVRCFDSNCLQCYEDFTNCTFCKQNFIVEKGSCICKVGLFKDDSGQCLPCSIPYCASCTNQSVCVKCMDTFILNTNGTACICDQFAGLAIITNISQDRRAEYPYCQTCSLQHCLKCTFVLQRESCYLCQQNYTLSDGGSCLCNTHQISGVCQVCQFPCFDCSSENPQECSSCYQNFHYGLQHCYLLTECKFPCERCKFNQGQQDTDCVLCFPPYILKNDHYCQCPQYTIENKNPQLGQSYCQPCPENCSRCSYNGQYLHCQSCFPPYVVNPQNASICILCPSKQGFSLVQKNCVNCTITFCQSCIIQQNGTQECLSCSKNKQKEYYQTNSYGNNYPQTVLNQTTKRCECVSMTGFNHDKTQCESCQVKYCQSCAADSSKCNACNQGLRLFQNRCICNQGGPNQMGICEPCQVQYCTRCFQSSKICETCNENFISVNTQCICKEGYALYEDKCAPCLVPNCLYCPTSTNQVCGKCKSPFVLNGQRTECVCPSGEGSNLANGCEKCQVSNCQQCSVSFQYQCNKCFAPFVLNPKKNQCICPYGQGFSQNGCKTCQIQNCASCGFFNDTICNQCGNNNVLEANFTKCVCPEEKQCFQCNIQNCHICQSLTQCASCQTPLRLNYQKTQCICPSGQGFNDFGQCQQCSIDNCEICSGLNLTECEQCIWPFLRGLDGQCDCPPETNCYNCNIDQCLICSSLSTCDSCVEPYIVDIKGKCSCPIGYVQDSEGKCSPCEVYNCASCSSTETSNCDQCMNNFTLTISQDKSILCLCSQGYGTNQQGHCQKCQVPYCNYCQNSDEVQCSKCQSGFELSTDQTECTCPLGTGISAIGTCEPCQVMMCSICPNSTVDNICIQCQHPLTLSTDGSSCDCPLGQYLENNACIECSIEYCDICEQQNNTEQCIQCADPYISINESCLCPDGIVPDSEGKCGQCYIQHCLSCSNNEQCDFCQKPYVNMNGTQCSCPIGYFQDKGACQKCQIIGCQQCNDASTCIKCLYPFIANHDNTLCSCPIGFFLNHYQSCQPCSIYRCAFCSDKSKCKRCFEPFILSHDRKKCTCPIGKGPTEFGSCAECSVENCAYCSEPFNLSSCRVCNRNFKLRVNGNGTNCICESPFILNQNNTCQCPAGYGFSKTQACAPCIINNCQNCEKYDDMECKKCFDGAKLSEDFQKCQCENGYGPINGQGCHKCLVQNCDLCQNALISQCLSCSKGFTKFTSEKQIKCLCLSPLVINQKGECECPEGSTWDFSTETCKLCSITNCIQCSLSNTTQCSLCLQPFIISKEGECVCPPGQGYDIEKGCSPCTINNCLACQPNNPNQCITCLDSVINLATGQQQCSCNSKDCQKKNQICLPGFVYDYNDKKCVKCPAQGCMICNSPESNYCLKCFANSVLIENKCKCIKGFTFNSSNLCSPCSDINCEQCDSQNNSICISCQNGFIVDKTTSQCLCSSSELTLNQNNQCVCVNGTMNTLGQCTACKIRNCKTCTGLNSLASCIQCFSPYVPDSSMKFCLCPPGTYMSQHKCKQCQDPNCQHCREDGKYCISCSPPFVLNAKGQCSCKTGFVLSNSVCQKCLVSNCAKCENSTESVCLECFYPALLNSDKKKCSCPVSYVSSITQRGCTPCRVKNCASCSNSMDKNCQTCLQNYILNEHSDECLCKSGYGPTPKGDCLPCMIKQCKICSRSFQTCSICSEPYVSNKDGTTCICPLGYGSNGQGGCAACQIHNCAECINSGDASCEKCIPPYIISSNKTLCLLSANIGQTCPIGHGKNPSTNICEPCQVQNCERCFKQSTKCSSCFSPFISNEDGSQCICPPGQGSNTQDGCAFCKVKNCQSCENAVFLSCNKCQSPFVLSENKQNCYMPINVGQNCPLGHGLSQKGICEPCKIENCVRCYSDSSFCLVCLEPYVLNSQGNQCVCPTGEAVNEKGGCSRCQVSNCAKCRSPNEPYCQQCQSPFVLHSDRHSCIWPYANIQQCPKGQGLDENRLCSQCKVQNCEKCTKGLDKCSICQFPFITSPDAKSCICPQGYGDNLAGGCSLCQVSDCMYCDNSMSKTCHVCKAPYKVSMNKKRCVQKKFNKGSSQDENGKIEEDEENEEDIGESVVDDGEEAANIGEDLLDVGKSALDFLYKKQTVTRGGIILIVLSTMIATGFIVGFLYRYLSRKGWQTNGIKGCESLSRGSLESPIFSQLEMESFQS